MFVLATIPMGIWHLRPRSSGQPALKQAISKSLGQVTVLTHGILQAWCRTWEACRTYRQLWPEQVLTALMAQKPDRQLGA